MKIYLVTHAHTEQHHAAAADTWQLSSRGRKEAQVLAAAPFRREVELVVVSSEPKTWLTVADVVAAYDLPVWVDSRFDELRRGGWVEDYAARVAAAFANPAAAVGGWEPVASVQQRALRALEDLQDRFSCQTLVVAGHGLCLSILRAVVLGHEQVNFSAWQKLPFGTYACINTAPLAMISDFVMAETSAR